MTSVVNTKFALKPVVAALALATAAGAAYAAPTPNQMPGAGQFMAASIGGAVQINGGGAVPLNTTITGLINGSRIDVAGKVVLNWGVTSVIDPLNPHGFNLGSNATLFFGADPIGGAVPAVLNVDVSGNPSQVYGNLISTAAPWAGCVVCTVAPAIFLSNANGIVVGAGGRIVAPTGVGLIGANMNTALARAEFTGDNGWLIPAPPTYGVSYLSFPDVTANGNVSIAGAINGDFVLNTPAKYILVAGNNLDVLNTGNLFGVTVELNMGVVATPTLQNVSCASNQTVSRLWNVDTGLAVACCTIGPFPGELQLAATGTGNVTNEGSISAAGTGVGEWITIQAKGNVRSGIAGSMDNQVGLFSDQGIYIDSFSNSSHVELYNVVSGYTTNKTLPFLYVNYYAAGSGFRPDVTINAITPGLQPSSIATTDEVTIYGGNVNILSTINHKSKTAGGTQNDTSLVVNGTKSVNIAADVGAGFSAYITSAGPLTISGNVLSDSNQGTAGGIYVVNNGANQPTTIAGTLTVPSSATGYGLSVITNGPLSVSGALVNVNSWVDVHNFGTAAGNNTTISGSISAGDWVHVANYLSPANTLIDISGTITATNDVDIDNFGASAGNMTMISGSVTSTTGIVDVYHLGLPTGKLTVTGSLNAGDDVLIFSDGHAQINTVNAGNDIFAMVLGTTLHVDGPWTAGNYLNITSPLAMTKFTPAALLSAPTIAFAGLSFTGVNSSWMNYADASEKPAAQLMTNSFNVALFGSINGPIAGNTNWPLNSMDIMPMFTLAPVLVSVTATGGGFQAVNLRVLGDAVVNSGATTTPFIGVPLTTGGLPAGGIQGNLGSQLILAADGYLQVMGMPTLSLFGPLLAFQWPGGASFIAGTTLQTFAPIYNAWSVASPPFGGVFFDAPYIALGSFIATSGTAWANFSSQPVTGDPTVYQIRQTSPSSFGFEATTAFVKNSYLNTVTGGVVCTTTGPTTWTVCP